MRASAAGVLMLLAVHVHAETGQATMEELPSAELLEFLADWETEDRQWLDPLEVENMPTITHAQGGDEDEGR